MKIAEKVKSTALKVVDKTKYVVASIGVALANTSVAQADSDFGTVTVNTDGVNASSAMGATIGILLTITRYAGVALLIFGAYEIVMSFMQQQPEAKTKGIIMALCGIVMIAMKSVLTAFGLSFT